MKIEASMDLLTLAGLMGRDNVPLEEAAGLRDLLVLDFAGRDTDDIEIGLWGTYCCAVDPAQQRR